MIRNLASQIRVRASCSLTYSVSLPTTFGLLDFCQSPSSFPNPDELARGFPFPRRSSSSSNHGAYYADSSTPCRLRQRSMQIPSRKADLHVARSCCFTIIEGAPIDGLERIRLSGGEDLAVRMFRSSRARNAIKVVLKL